MQDSINCMTTQNFSRPKVGSAKNLCQHTNNMANIGDSLQLLKKVLKMYVACLSGVRAKSVYKKEEG